MKGRGPNTAPVEPHYTIEELAKLANVSQETIRRKIKLGETTNGAQGIFPVRKLGHRQIRIPASAANRWIDGSNTTI